jgi:primosomal protein N'
MGTIPERLVAELNRRVSPGVAELHPTDLPIGVGTERDLAGLQQVGVAVAADVDGLLLGTGYRTTEEALRQLARLASLVSPESGSRLIMQTNRPESLLVTTMRRGDPIPYLERVLVDRAREGFPPALELLALEVRGQVPVDVGADLASLQRQLTLLGPMPVEDGQRWLLSGKLGKAKSDLRSMVGRWRDRGATVRVDVDPIDL